MQLFRLKNALHKSTTTKFVKTIALVATLVILAVLPCRFCIAQEEENSSDSAADVFITMRDQHNADFQLELSHKPADPDALRAAGIPVYVPRFVNGSENSFSVVVPESQRNAAVALLHRTFVLQADAGASRFAYGGEGPAREGEGGLEVLK